MSSKELLIPVLVPWMVSPSVPYLRLHVADNGKPIAATFIGFFKCEDSQKQVQPHLVVVNDPGEFVTDGSSQGAQYRQVKIQFNQGEKALQKRAFSEYDIIEEARYDWSRIPSGLQNGETPEESVSRVQSLWVSTGNCPDPSMYEVQGSKWLNSLGLDAKKWKHYILVGHDDYLEVVARGWRWESGRPVT